MIAPLITGLALAMVAVHVAQVIWFAFPSGQIKNLHVGFALVLLTLGWLEKTPRERRWTRAALALVVLAALAPVVYIQLEYEALVGDRIFSSEPLDLVFAVVLLAVALVVSWREMGAIVPLIALGALAYGRWGYLFPGEVLFHSGIDWERLVSYTSIPAFSGLLGALTEESANTIFIFMVYAGLLEAVGGMGLIMKLSYALGGQTRGGPAQVAVVSSGLMGMINGSTVANVVTTGAFTIPMMKRVGYKPAFAGAVEAVASTGGQITPPVMGLAAFLMAGITGIPYAEIALAAALPALIFYLQLMAAVHLEAAKMGLSAVGHATGLDTELDRMSLGRACLSYAHLLASLVVLVYFMMVENRTAAAALYAAATIIAGELLKSGFRRGGKAAIAGFVIGARSGAQIAVIVAVVGVMVEMFVVTGFAQKLSFLMLGLAEGRLFPLLFIAALACLFFGIGLPTSASYILVALLGAPALEELGVPKLAAHLFCFYFANVSAITPPVAVGSLVAANMAGADFWRTSWISIWLGLPGYLLPFLFVIRPEILGLDGAAAGEQIGVALIALVAIVSLTCAFIGWMAGPLAWWERLLLVAVAAALLKPDWLTTVVGFALLAAIVARQAIAYRALPRAAPAARVEEGPTVPLNVDLAKYRSDGP
jgi:TRAP transporter 4TM/12TM fusion protein